jgi:hypothetical protein
MDKGRGRRERRTLRATTAWNKYLDWPGVAQVGQIESVVEQDGNISHETRYFITDVPRDLTGASRLLVLGQGHWLIENRSHYVRDVTLGKDASRIRKGSGREIMAALRNTVIGLLRITNATNIAETVRRNASQVRMLFTRLGIVNSSRTPPSTQH